MIVVSDHVLSAAIDYAAANATLAGLVAGGCHRRVASEKAMPYAVVTCSAGESEDFSGSDYVQSFRVEFVAYLNDADPNIGAILAAMASLFDRSADFTVPEAERVLSVVVNRDEAMPDPRDREARGVYQARRAWDVLVQASRGSAAPAEFSYLALGGDDYLSLDNGDYLQVGA